MVVECINASRYALTVGRNYNVIEETRDLYIIVNDNNATVRYRKNFFREVPNGVVEPARQGNRIQAVDVAAAQPAAPQPPQRVRRTNQQIIDSIQVSISLRRPEHHPFAYASPNTNNLTVSVKYDSRVYVEDAPRMVESSVTVNTKGCHTSCGIGNIYNLNGFETFHRAIVDYQEDDYDGVREAIYEKIKTELKQFLRPHTALVLASTVEDAADVITALEAIGFDSENLGRNPNSGNNIVLLKLKLNN